MKEQSNYIFGFGMFAAGFSSAITAPLASAITAKSLFDKNANEKWRTKGIYFRLIYLGVLFVGLAFGISEVDTIYVITIAQALNGLILPFISIFLIFVINDPCLMGVKNINGWFSNILMAIVVWVTMIIGTINIIKSIQNALIKAEIISKAGFLNDNVVIIICLITFIISIGILLAIRKFRDNFVD